jgi:YHS domain-containing protein
MGEPFVYAYKGREIKFCCKNCLKDFNKDPAKYLKLIDEAEAKAKKAKS